MSKQIEQERAAMLKQTAQLVRVTVKYLQKHPEELHMTAGSLVSNAFYVAFPCGEGE